MSVRGYSDMVEYVITHPATPHYRSTRVSGGCVKDALWTLDFFTFTESVLKLLRDIGEEIKGHHWNRRV